jgi:thioredoxin reductase
MLDWLIIGGGIHGTHLSFVLSHQHGISRDRIRVLDPYERPLARWHSVTANTGMQFLRSPLVHHLHYDQRAMGVFARIHQKEAYTKFIPTYSRPSLELFNRHSQYLIDKYKLESMRMVGRALGLTRTTDGWRVETENGGIEARRVVLAIGMSEQPYYPEWAKRLKNGNAPINHIFDHHFVMENLPDWSHLVVVGGGITAAQTALYLAQRNPVTVVMRHPIRIHDFDSDPCWMNVLCLNDFHKIEDFNKRRDVIKAARHRGSLPMDVAQAFEQAIREGYILPVQADITDAHSGNRSIQLDLSNAETLTADRILLATGWEQARPGGQWLEDTIQNYDLSVANCGFPIIDKSLCWSEGLYVSGPLAELEIGPPSRNIIGARMAGERLPFY